MQHPESAFSRVLSHVSAVALALRTAGSVPVTRHNYNIYRNIRSNIKWLLHNEEGGRFYFFGGWAKITLMAHELRLGVRMLALAQPGEMLGRDYASKPIAGQASLAIRYVPAGRGSSGSAPERRTPARDTSAPGWPRVALRWRAWGVLLNGSVSRSCLCWNFISS
jgi:hypothetical protein